MNIDRDETKDWWLRFDVDDLIDAEELIAFVMFHKVQGSSDYSLDEKNDILVGWERVQGALWDRDYD